MGLAFVLTAAGLSTGCDTPLASDTQLDRPDPAPETRAPDETPDVPARTGAVGAAGLERAIAIHEEDPQGARSLLRAGCDRGDVPSCIALSEMLEADGTEEALGEAAAVIEQACAAGSTDACDRMGH